MKLGVGMFFNMQVYIHLTDLSLLQEPNPVFVPKKLCLLTHQELNETVARKSTRERFCQYRMVGYPRPFLHIPHQHQVANPQEDV